MTLTIPDDVAAQADCSHSELVWGLVIGLLYQGRLTLGQAGSALGLTKPDFMARMSEQGLAMPYSVADAAQDLDTLDRIWPLDDQVKSQ